ncbi:hypothetical protein L1285_16835 [Pseudoalteromonas sp. DL2-H2.2]|uniref:hypothetical protein n=1 Tax=Pseudoalteromonas sp. DL2-H2.2 TaxID=2908889 RepID=UPI001F38495E|nr:hypothetical protein [Pseudoalteromonas sp. DL2-H2.2]MCF2909988.1 hypothetical protein [Pseudoalteromonas sp. DL2-H2.2]
MIQTPAIHGVMKKDIEEKLGKLPNVTVFSGFIQQHIKDLIQGGKLPAIVVQPGDDIPSDAKNDTSKISREIKVAALVDAGEKDTTVERLDDLLFQIRQSLYVAHEELSVSTIRLGPAKFDYPEPGEQIAVVETSITVTYQEKWREE